MREDRQPAVWRALGLGWERPNARSGPAWLDDPELLGPLDGDDEEARRPSVAPGRIRRPSTPSCGAQEDDSASRNGTTSPPPWGGLLIAARGGPRRGRCALLRPRRRSLRSLPHRGPGGPRRTALRGPSRRTREEPHPTDPSRAVVDALRLRVRPPAGRALPDHAAPAGREGDRSVRAVGALAGRGPRPARHHHARGRDGRSAGPLPRRRRGGGLGQCPERSGRARPPAGHHRHDAPSRCRGALREPVRGPRRSFHPRVDSSRGDGGTATVTQLRHPPSCVIAESPGPTGPVLTEDSTESRRKPRH